MPGITIVIGTRNRLPILRRCLDALIDRIHMEHEIFVVDAGSTDGTLEYLEGLSGIRLVCDGRPIGQAQSLNRVFRTITSTYVSWLSDDSILQPGMIDLSVGILEENPDIGMVALKVKDVKGAHTSPPYIGGFWSTEILTCNQGVIRTQVLKDVDYFDEVLRDYGIDADLTAKVLSAGYKVVYTKKVAIHHHRDYESAPGVLESWERAGRMKAGVDLYNRKYAGLFQFSLSDRVTYRLFWIFSLGVGFLNWIAGKAGLHFESVFEYNLRDWYNVLRGRYISKWDLWENRERPFYLVQEIRNHKCR